MKQTDELSNDELEREKIVQEKLDIARDFKNTFNTPHGRRVLQRMLHQCHVLNTDRSGHEPSIFYKEGRRSVFMDILEILGKNEEQILEFILNKGQSDEEDDL